MVHPSTKHYLFSGYYVLGIQGAGNKSEKQVSSFKELQNSIYKEFGNNKIQSFVRVCMRECVCEREKETDMNQITFF